MSNIYTSSNPESVTAEYMNLLGFNLSVEEATDELHMHPDYPNLLAINDVMNHFGASVDAYKVGMNDLKEVPCPFLAHTTSEGQEYVLITEVSQTGFTLSTGASKSKLSSFDDFNKIFDGVILVAQNTLKHSPHYRKRGFSLDRLRSRLVAGLAFIIIVSTVSLLFEKKISWATLIVAMVKTSGLGISMLLLIQSIDRNNPLVQTLCSGGSKVNCNAILSSKAANVFPGLTWSDVGFFYFAGTWLSVMLIGNDNAGMQLLAILNMLSLPYTFYSVYYQARIAKQWCLLCCITQVLLWLEFIFLLTYFKQPFSLPNTDSFLTIIIGLFIPVTGWLLLKPLILKKQQGDTLKEQLRKFKYNNKVFDHLLKERPKYMTPNSDWSIVLGDPKAEHVITMVSNPYCPPCGTAHKMIDQWLATHPEVQFRIVFTANNTDEDYKTPVTRHLMALNQLGDKALVRHALHQWYEQKQKSYEKWSRSYPVDLRNADFEHLDRQKEWCNTAEIRATPTFLLNGHVLPELYHVRDIKYMLDFQP